MLLYYMYILTLRHRLRRSLDALELALVAAADLDEAGAAEEDGGRLLLAIYIYICTYTYIYMYVCKDIHVCVYIYIYI